MPNTKTGGSRWVPDIRPEQIDTYTETNGSDSAEYKLVDVHPILGGVLNRLAFFRTHVGAIWYNKLGGKSLKQKLDEIDASINGLNSNLGNLIKVYEISVIPKTLDRQYVAIKDYHDIGNPRVIIPISLAPISNADKVLSDICMQGNTHVRFTPTFTNLTYIIRLICVY